MSSAESQPWLPEQFEFLAGIPEPERQGRVCLMIQGYIDDSGTKGTDLVFTLAGFIGPAEKWAALSNNWRDHLKTPPSIRFLKMNEAAKLDGEFRFWEAKDRDAKLVGFVDIIKRHTPQKAIHVTIDLKAFERHMAPHLYKPMSNPYFIGSNAIMAGIGHEVLDSGILEEPEIIFDEHLIFGPRLKMWYPLIKAAMKGRADYDSRADGIHRCFDRLSCSPARFDVPGHLGMSVNVECQGTAQGMSEPFLNRLQWNAATSRFKLHP